jgi:hypothetical protein
MRGGKEVAENISKADILAIKKSIKRRAGWGEISEGNNPTCSNLPLPRPLRRSAPQTDEYTCGI